MNFNEVKSLSSMGTIIVLTSPFGHASHFSFHLEFGGTNNMVKYEAPLHGFKLS